MLQTEMRPTLSLEGFLSDKCRAFGLSEYWVSDLPRGAQQMLLRLDKLTSFSSGGSVSMFAESLMSGACVEQNPDLFRTAIGINDPAQLEQAQKDVIYGTLLSDLGKVAKPELIWLYESIAFEPVLVAQKLPHFLATRYGAGKEIPLMQLPYKVAMDFYRELIFNGSGEGNEWDLQRQACDSLLTQMCFNQLEHTLHDVMTGAHLLALSDLLVQWGIADDPAWQGAILIAKNHHISRGLIEGKYMPHQQEFLANVLPPTATERWLRLCLFEETMDMVIAASVRKSRAGDVHGIHSVARITDNLRTSLATGRIDANDIETILESLATIQKDGEVDQSIATWIQAYLAR